MKRLNELFSCNYDTIIKGIKINSKEVEEGDLFVCTMGVTADRHDYIDDAIQKGAAAIVVQKNVGAKPVPIIMVKNTNEILHPLCNKFYDKPIEKLKIIAITGTDGKTSSALILQALIGDDCAYLGSNGRICSKFKREISNTTPDADKLYLYLDEFVQAGCKYVVMEASSEGFYRERLKGLKFDLGALTNVTVDHLNIHGSFENYLDCKKQLFKQLKSDAFGVLNIDDKFYEEFLKITKKPFTYGIHDDANLRFDYQLYSDHTMVNFYYGQEKYTVRSPLVASFNVYNLACALSIVISLGLNPKEALERINNIQIEGRLEHLNIDKDFDVIIDYAHTINAIKKLFDFYKQVVKGRIVVVVGAAGARERLKRSVIGKYLADNTDKIYFTTDDPFTEDPKAIIDELIKDIKDYFNYEIVIDRKEAIAKAIKEAQKDDSIFIIGRGSENYQTVGYEKIYLNDKEEVLKNL